MGGNHTGEELYIDEVREIIQSSMEDKCLSYQSISDHIGVDKVFFVATIFGQQSLPSEAANKLSQVLEIDKQITDSLTALPSRSSDPFVYRLHEILEVYGESLKELMLENFGDGILSAVDVKVHFEKKGDRAIITLDSKYLPYKPY